MTNKYILNNNMSSTVENTNTNILKKIKELRNILNIYNQYQIDEKNSAEVKSYTTQLDEIESSYEFGSIDILPEYYRNKHNNEAKSQYYNMYMNFVASENVMSKLKRIYNLCCKLQKIYDINDEKLIQSFSDYDFTPVNVLEIEHSNDICICGKKYTIESKNSEFVCHSCGNTERLYGAVFEDEQFWFQEGQRTKHGKYDPTKHCKFWVDRIQAKENTEIPKEVLHKIIKCIKSDDIWLEQLDCSMIRRYLKILKLTQYNDHISLILKLITKKEPEQLTDKEQKMLYVYFARVIQIYTRIKPPDKLNCVYHPFFIYKILEQLIRNSRRRRSILSCIHLQSRETLIENDRIWKNICEEIPEFTYIPTECS